MHQQLNMLVTHLTGSQLEAGLDEIRRSPKDAGRALSLRGINARVVQAGTIRRGDIARKL